MTFKHRIYNIRMQLPGNDETAARRLIQLVTLNHTQWRPVLDTKDDPRLFSLIIKAESVAEGVLYAQEQGFKLYRAKQVNPREVTGLVFSQTDLTVPLNTWFLSSKATPFPFGTLLHWCEVD